MEPWCFVVSGGKIYFLAHHPEARIRTYFSQTLKLIFLLWSESVYHYATTLTVSTADILHFKFHIDILDFKFYSWHSELQISQMMFWTSDLTGDILHKCLDSQTTVWTNTLDQLNSELCWLQRVVLYSGRNSHWNTTLAECASFSLVCLKPFSSDFCVSN